MNDSLISNSVFPLQKKCNDSKFDNIIDPIHQTKSLTNQNPKVLRYDWQSLALAEPRDNRNFKPPKGNLHKSSYLRFGRDNLETGISETNEKLREIESKDNYTAIFPRRNTLNMFSHGLTENDEDREKILRSSGFQTYPYNYGCTDYRTTSRSEYRLHHPIKESFNYSKDNIRPWLFYRRTLSYGDEQLSNRNCYMKYNDDGMNIHNDIAVFKIDRYQSYDPISKEYTKARDLAKHKRDKINQ